MISEYEHQRDLFEWARHPSTLKKYTGLDLLFAINNGLKLSIGQAVKAKKAGTKRGVCDLFLPVPKKHFHGLFIEMKKEDGVLSKEQKEFIQKMIDNCYEVKVCYGFYEAKIAIEEYLK